MLDLFEVFSLSLSLSLPLVGDVCWVQIYTWQHHMIIGSFQNLEFFQLRELRMKEMRSLDHNRPQQSKGGNSCQSSFCYLLFVKRNRR